MLSGSNNKVSNNANTPVTGTQISIPIETIKVEIPDSNVLDAAFERFQGLESFVKPIVIEAIAKRLKVSKKAVEKSYEIWMMERISSMTANTKSEEGR